MILNSLYILFNNINTIMLLKKIFLCFSCICAWLFLTNSTFAANNGALSDVLDLTYGIEKAQLNLSTIKPVSFKSDTYKQMYAHTIEIDTQLRNIFIKKYQDDSFDYYQTSWIITNYNNFIYFTNKYFQYLSLKEKKPTIKEYDDLIMENYRQMRISYNRVQYLVNPN